MGNNNNKIIKNDTRTGMKDFLLNLNRNWTTQDAPEPVAVNYKLNRTVTYCELNSLHRKVIDTKREVTGNRRESKDNAT